MKRCTSCIRQQLQYFIIGFICESAPISVSKIATDLSFTECTLKTRAVVGCADGRVRAKALRWCAVVWHVRPTIVIVAIIITIVARAACLITIT